MFFLPCKSQELPISYQNALSIIFLKNKPCGFKIVFSILTSIFQNYSVSIPTVINPDLFRKVILHTISRRKRKEDGFSRKFHGKKQKNLNDSDRGNRGSDRRWHFFIFIFVATKNNCIRVQGQL